MTMGFAFHFNNYDFSFIHCLYKEGIIKHKAFSIVRGSTEFRGKIYYGGIPKEIYNTFVIKGGDTLYLYERMHLNEKCNGNCKAFSC